MNDESTPRSLGKFLRHRPAIIAMFVILLYGGLAAGLLFGSVMTLEDTLEPPPRLSEIQTSEPVFESISSSGSLITFQSLELSSINNPHRLGIIIGSTGLLL